MARSYKKFPIVKQEKVDKKWWNRTIRHKKLDYSLRGSQYKKIMINFNTWQYRWSLQQALADYDSGESGWNSREELIEYWKYCCYRK